MTWAKFDDGMVDHRKVRRALRAGGLATFGLHVAGILHSARYLTDGVVEREFLDDIFDIARTKPREQRTVLDALQANALWVPGDDGTWSVHDYLEHNPSRSQVQERRRQDAERKADGRRTMSKRSPAGHDADSRRTAAGVRAVSARPVPSHTHKDPPSPPEGGRRRDQQDYEDQLRSYATGLLPDADPAEALSAVKGALGNARARHDMPTNEHVLTELRRWHPELVEAVA